MLFSCSKNMYPNKEQVIAIKEYRGHIFFDLKVNGYNKGNFCFDTGSSNLIIDSTFYKRQEMIFNQYSTQKIIGASEKIAKMISINDTINVMANHFFSYSYNNLVYNLKDFTGKEKDGLAGHNIFGQTPFKIDYYNKKIEVNPIIDDGYQEINIRYNGNLMFVPLKLTFKDGSVIEGDFALDTGAKELSLSSDFVNSEVLTNSKKVNFIKNGLSGNTSGFTLYLSEMKIGRFIINNRMINVSKDKTGALSKNKDMIGLIGNNYLRDLDIVFHPSAKKIWIRPNKNFNIPAEDLFKNFIVYETTKGWFVGGIYEESDAYQKGLRHRDEILEINNRSVDKMNIDRFHKRLKPNQKLKLKVKRNNEIFEIDTYLNVILRKDD